MGDLARHVGRRAGREDVGCVASLVRVHDGLLRRYTRHPRHNARVHPQHLLHDGVEEGEGLELGVGRDLGAVGDCLFDLVLDALVHVGVREEFVESGA